MTRGAAPGDRRLALLAGLVCVASAGGGCRAPERAETAESFIAAVESAHGRSTWSARRALQGRVSLSFGGTPALAGRILFRTDLGASRLELDDGTIAVFDGESAWVSPASSPLKRARFHLLTWPYFTAMPYKLRDPGARLQVLGERTLRGKRYRAARLTFDAGVGDTPEDWYVVYRDPASGRLEAAAYIVTYGKDAAAAQSEPHAISYADFVAVDGAQIATTWQFWNWSEDAGLVGEPTGNGKLTDLRFVEPAADAFTRPSDAQEDRLPNR